MTKIQITRRDVLAFKEWQYSIGIKQKEYNISLRHA